MLHACLNYTARFQLTVPWQTRKKTPATQCNAQGLLYLSFGGERASPPASSRPLLPCWECTAARTWCPELQAVSEQRTGKLLPAPLVQGSAGDGQQQENEQFSQTPSAVFCLGLYHHIELYSQEPVLEMYFGWLLLWHASIKSRECSCVSSLTKDREHLSQTFRIRHGRHIF